MSLLSKIKWLEDRIVGLRSTLHSISDGYYPDNASSWAKASLKKDDQNPFKPSEPSPEDIEKVAQAIYHSEDGFTDEDYFQATGKHRRIWKTDAPWDSQPEVELSEWERDDYRWQAKAAIEAMVTEC